MAHSEEVAGDKTGSLGQGTEKEPGTGRQVAEWQPSIHQPVKEWRGTSQATGTAWLSGEEESKLETGTVKGKGLGPAQHQGTMLTGHLGRNTVQFKGHLSICIEYFTFYADLTLLFFHNFPPLMPSVVRSCHASHNYVSKSVLAYGLL